MNFLERTSVTRLINACDGTNPPSLFDCTVFEPLERVGRPTVSTAAAAYYLNRRPQTLRSWACNDDGPIRPIRINGRLGWPVSKLRQLLGETQ
jgi:hypothetical protein